MKVAGQAAQPVIARRRWRTCLRTGVGIAVAALLGSFLQTGVAVGAEAPMLTVSWGTEELDTALIIMAPCLMIPPCSYSLPTM